jgi:MOSC domain-containing protein YiiM
MAILFERGNNTIWAPVVLHIATYTIRLVDLSEPQYLTAVGIWLLLQIGMVFLVYLFLNNLLKHKLKNEAKNMQLVSVNLGQERMLKNKHRTERTGIFKFPVEGPVKVAKLGLEGDIIISKKHHGGPDQAVYVYGDADYAWWSGELNKEIFPGTFGDNLTISELESAQFNIGDTIHFSDVILQVTSPRIPCATFAARMEDPQWVKRFRHAERPGLYCRVIKEGFIKAGDRVSIEKYTGETISITEMFHDYYDRNKSEEMLRRQLNAPIAIRARRDMEKELQKLLAQS